MTDTNADVTIEWDFEFVPFTAKIVNGIVSEYRDDTMIGQWTMQRADQYDKADDRWTYDFGTTSGPEYSCGPVGQVLVAWVDDDAYVLTETEIGKTLSGLPED